MCPAPSVSCCECRSEQEVIASIGFNFRDGGKASKRKKNLILRRRSKVSRLFVLQIKIRSREGVGHGMGHLTLQLSIMMVMEKTCGRGGEGGAATKIEANLTIKTTQRKQTAPLYHLALEAIYFPCLGPETLLLCSSPKG